MRTPYATAKRATRRRFWTQATVALALAVGSLTGASVGFRALLQKHLCEEPGDVVDDAEMAVMLFGIGMARQRPVLLRQQLVAKHPDITDRQRKAFTIGRVV